MAQVTVSRDSRMLAASDAGPPLVAERSPAAAGAAAAGFDWGSFSRAASDEVTVGECHVLQWCVSCPHLTTSAWQP